MFEVLRALREGLHVESTWVLMLTMALIVGSLGGVAGYMVDVPYKKELSGRQDGRKDAAQPGQHVENLTCPVCGSHKALPIIYGMPTEEHMQLVMQGKAAAGGAIRRLLTGKAPTWECGACKHRWRGGLFTGGSGASVEDAVVIRGIANTAVGIRAEKQWLIERFGLDRNLAQEPSGWKLVSQSVSQSLVEGAQRVYDMVTIRLPNGAERTVYFDITSFFGK